MNERGIIAIVFMLVFVCSCKKESSMSNGETIFRTGKNKQGKIMMDINSSRIKAPASCQDCHGRNGGNILNRKESIKYKDLSDSSLRDHPYDDILIERFLDEELKNDGSPANTGVVWEMSRRDKLDLIEFLKTLR